MTSEILSKMDNQNKTDGQELLNAAACMFLAGLFYIVKLIYYLLISSSYSFVDIMEPIVLVFTFWCMFVYLAGEIKKEHEK